MQFQPIPSDYRFNNLTGQSFGRWAILGYVGRKHSQAMWLCRCDCGVERAVAGNALTGGRTSSCRPCAITLHGGTGTPEHKAWMSLISRCTNPQDHCFPRYGGRGITVCQRWLKSFAAFLEDVGKRPSSRHSIERIDNDGNYKPTNCRWATTKEQMRNRECNRLVTFNGKTQCLSAWADELGIKRATLDGRLRAGWPIEYAFTIPSQRQFLARLPLLK